MSYVHHPDCQSVVGCKELCEKCRALLAVHEEHRIKAEKKLVNDSILILTSRGYLVTKDEGYVRKAIPYS